MADFEPIFDEDGNVVGLTYGNEEFSLSYPAEAESVSARIGQLGYSERTAERKRQSLDCEVPPHA